MAKLVDIQGRFPCEPDNKKPTLIKKWEYSTNVINLRDCCLLNGQCSL